MPPRMRNHLDNTNPIRDKEPAVMGCLRWAECAAPEQNPAKNADRIKGIKDGPEGAPTPAGPNPHPSVREPDRRG